MFKVVFSRQADRTLRRMPRNTAQLLREHISTLAADPHAPNNIVRPLTGRPGFRLRVGDWRILYELQDQQLVILVLSIGTRGQVYR